VTRDWLVVDSCLEATPVRFDAADPYHALGARLTELLVRDYSDIDCVLLVGSAAIRSAGQQPRDLDITVLVARDDLGDLAERMTATVQPATELRVDLLVASTAMLAATPELSLATAFRSLVLFGTAPWPSPLRIPAATIASAQWKDRHRELRGHLARLKVALDGDAPADAELVERVQKRALRLIAPVALERIGIYSIDVARCAELVATILPESAQLAAAVADDIARGAHDLDAIDRAVDLALAVMAAVTARGSTGTADSNRG